MLDTRPPTASMGGYGLPPPSRAESSFKHYPEDMDNGPEVINVTANATTTLLPGMGGFHLVDLIITELKDHMTCYEFGCSHWWKMFFVKKNPLQGLLSSLNAVISTNERN